MLSPETGTREPGGLRLAVKAFMLLVAITIVSGAFVAGLNAGLTYNTFPLMDGRIVPQGYALIEPFWLNWFENVTAVQFNHRLLAVTTVAVARPWGSGPCVRKSRRPGAPAPCWPWRRLPNLASVLLLC